VTEYRFTMTPRAGVIVFALFIASAASLPAAAEAPSAPPAATRNIGGRGDYALREKLVRMLSHDSNLAKESISVILVNGGVVFSGYISNYALKRRAMTIASTIRGVINVTDLMTVTRADLPDATLAKAVGDLLTGLADPLGLKGLEVSASDGTITLKGTVTNFRARVRAEESAGTVMGVTNIVNLLQPVDAPAGTDDRSIVKAVAGYLDDFRQYTYAGNIEVSASQGAVTLKGEVPFPLARQQAGTMAAVVRGVRSVENLLTVDPSLERREATVKGVP
jgi:osmotically-inducible protein OsmY